MSPRHNHAKGHKKKGKVASAIKFSKRVPSNTAIKQLARFLERSESIQSELGVLNTSSTALSQATVRGSLSPEDIDRLKAAGWLDASE